VHHGSVFGKSSFPTAPVGLISVTSGRTADGLMDGWPNCPGAKMQKAPRCGAFKATGVVLGSDVEAEVHHVAILDDVFLAFQAPFAGFLGPGFALVLDEVVVGDDF